MPLIMGILNVTPDSFYEKSRCECPEKAFRAAKKMIKDGADIIDIGGESSRPGASPVNETEEIKRVIPVIKEIRKQNKKIHISIDTVKPGVAKLALKYGATMLNDISGFDNEKMIEIAKSYSCDLCVMHMQNNPKTMQQNPYYEKGVVSELLYFFEKKVKNLLKNKIDESKIIIDPGIGFGKTVSDNIQILKNIKIFKALGFRLLVGISRKSFMGKILNKPPSKLLLPTLFINSILIKEGIDILRVHDVPQHKEMAKLFKVF